VSLSELIDLARQVGRRTEQVRDTLVGNDLAQVSREWADLVPRVRQARLTPAQQAGGHENWQIGTPHAAEVDPDRIAEAELAEQVARGKLAVRQRETAAATDHQRQARKHQAAVLEVFGQLQERYARGERGVEANLAWTQEELIRASVATRNADVGFRAAEQNEALANQALGAVGQRLAEARLRKQHHDIELQRFVQYLQAEGAPDASR
jgi:hypothetical protein